MTDEAELEAFRREKEDFLLTDPMSPLAQEERNRFRGLTYYPVDPGLEFIVTPDPYDEPETIAMPTSDGRIRPYERWAQIQFEVSGQPFTLTVYRDEESGHLFLPFLDKTSGDETYGAGRYLELPVLEDGDLLLDFNYAYHPFCAYSPRYSCPLPPEENRLPIAIRAGERNA